MCTFAVCLICVWGQPVKILQVYSNGGRPGRYAMDVENILDHGRFGFTMPNGTALTLKCDPRYKWQPSWLRPVRNAV